MKNVILIIIGMLFTTSSFADADFDLKCTLDDGVQMTVSHGSHGSHTVYIAFFAPGDDPDEGGGVIKLDIPSAEVKQDILHHDGRIIFFGLRGESPDSESMIVVSYRQDMKVFIGKKPHYSDVMTFYTLNKITGDHTEDKCIPDTIQLGNTLTQYGIPHVMYVK